MSELPVLINGDDILFPSDDELYSIWSEEIKKVGFEKSLGKNYLHRDFLFINSQPYRVKRDRSRNLLSFERHRFFNVGLLTGQSKVTGREEAKSASYASCYNECVSGSRSPMRCLRRFIHYNLFGLKKESGNSLFNFFIPRVYGGLEMTLPSDSCFRYTRTQNWAATAIYEEFSKPGLTKVKDHKIASTVVSRGGEVSILDKINSVRYGYFCVEPKISPVRGDLLVDAVDPWKNRNYNSEISISCRSFALNRTIGRLAKPLEGLAGLEGYKILHEFSRSAFLKRLSDQGRLYRSI